MNYTPLDIQNIEIKKTAIGGLSEIEVKTILDEVAEDYQDYIKDITRLKSEVETMKAAIDQYKVLEETLQNTLLVAQQNCDEMKTAAEEHTKNMICEAELKAEKIVFDAGNKVYELQRQIQELNLKAMTFKMQYQSVLEAELKFLNQIPESDREHEMNIALAEAAVTAENIADITPAEEQVCVNEFRDEPEEAAGEEVLRDVAAVAPVYEEETAEPVITATKNEPDQIPDTAKISENVDFEEKYKASSLFTSKFFKQDSYNEETADMGKMADKVTAAADSNTDHAPTTLRTRNVGADYRRNRFRKEMLDD